MHTLSALLSLGAVILAFLFVIVAFAERNYINGRGRLYQWFYFAGLVFLAVTAVRTVNDYIYPEDERVFRNVDYHILEHKGFKTDSVFYLVRGQFPNDYFPEMALWDGKSGVVRLSPDSIFVADFCEPLFIERHSASYKKSDSLTRHRGNAFVLANKVITADVATDGLTITRNAGDRTDTLYRLTVFDDREPAMYISSSSLCGPDTSMFRKRINRGYPLSEIIAQSPRFEFGEELQELLEGTFLVRESIPIINNFGGESSKKNTSSLTVSPGANLYYSDDVQVNGEFIEHRTFLIPHKGKTLLYAGIGRSRSDIFSLSCNPEDRGLELRYILPKMHKLKDSGGRLFLSSSVESILADSKDGGYYFNIFDNDNNFNNINGEIRYVPGTARENMVFEVMDVYSDNPSETIRVAASRGGESDEFFMSVRAKSQDKTKWIFDVKDLRESNPMKARGIVLFVLVFVFLVGLRILTDSFVTPHTITIIELSAYVVVLCLCVVRLVIGWRASTFVPIEDITAPVFAKMRSSILGTTRIAWLLPVSMICISLRQVLRSVRLELETRFLRHGWACRTRDAFSGLAGRLKEWAAALRKRVSSAFDGLYKKAVPPGLRERIKAVMDSAPNKDVLLFFILVLAVCAICARGPLERLLNIPVPLVAYLMCDYWLIGRSEKSRVGTARLFAAVVAFGYLFVRDAGFTIILFVFLFLYHAVIGTLVNGTLMQALIGKQRWVKATKGRNWLVYLVSLGFCVLLLLFLKYEGDIMIWGFNHVGTVLLVVGVCTGILFLTNLREKKKTGQNGILVRLVYLVATVLLLSAGAFESIPGSSHYISDKVNSKVHMKYRAEVQKLREDQKIDDLIERCDFKSTDITYIMRSAHNQWFINQYLRAGENMKSHGRGRPFVIQPHSNQGSTFTTQTTDLVVTRYVLAEHGTRVVALFMVLFLMLILGYVFEVKVQDNRKRAMMAPIVLLFVIALMVALSATNRIVFVGQDFPFISLQSRVAVIFPLALLFMAIYAVTRERFEGLSSVEGRMVQSRKWAIVAGLLVFAVSSATFIKQQGKNQNERQFDVSQLIGSLSGKVDILDRSLMKYQLNHPGVNTLSKDSLWYRFANDSEYSAPLKEILNDKTDSSRFYRSLVEYFETRQAVKNNPEELLHMRKRSNYWHLALNRKHFFIPSLLEESLQWQGSLLAAKTKRLFSFKTTHNYNEKLVIPSGNYENNILPASVQKQVENVRISRFDPSWGDSDEPLLLINSYNSVGSPQFFHIESSERSLKGSPSGHHQIATRIKEGDFVMVNKLDRRGEEKEVLGWMYGRDNENYLAKNIWMNGHQRLFYPLGKESMWSYQFANAVSNAFGQSDEYRDRTLRVSIDSELHGRFYDILSRQNGTKMKLRASTVQQLQAFKELALSDMQNERNTTGFFLDPVTKEVRYKKKATGDVGLALNRINRLLSSADEDMDRDAQVANAIDQVIERKFDFSAVVLDGNGRIRLLFDHTRSRNVDPNNIRFFNKFMSDLYKNGDNQSERDFFGNKALHILPSGPGSSFKPIAYTSITSRENIPWETLDVLTDYREEAKSKPNPKQRLDESSTNTMYDYYGGVDCAKLGQPMSIDGNSGLEHNNYLIKSNNLYHSAVILLGMQPQGELERVFKPAGSDKYAFPVMKYQGRRVSFNPDVWFPNNKLNTRNGIMNDGLFLNFRLQGDLVNQKDRYSNYFGESAEFDYIYRKSSSFRVWTYPETGSLNNSDRNLEPRLRNGFNQMLLGAYPLEVSPLQMATMGMRLATLNRTQSLTTLDDQRTSAPEYEFFEVPTWDEGEYLKFFQRQVLAQLRQVPLAARGGTARALDGLARRLASQGYYMYAKTGTLNDGRLRANKSSRMKHLLVIIADRPLESVSSVAELKDVRYYVLYLSYIGVNISEGFSTAQFRDMISAVANSELFREYMEE